MRINRYNVIRAIEYMHQAETLRGWARSMRKIGDHKEAGHYTRAAMYALKSARIRLHMSGLEPSSLMGMVS